jgi:hypothetical protein
MLWVKVSVKEVGTHKRLWVKRTKVLASSLVKPTVVANTLVWNFIVEKLQSKIVVISWVMYTQSFRMIWGYRTIEMVEETFTQSW